MKAALLAMLAILSACTGPEPSPAELRPLPPGLPDAEDSIRRELEQRHAAARRAIANAELADGSRAARVGNLGISYLAYSYFADAAEIFTTATMLAPDEFRWHYFRGHSLRRTGDMEGAAEAFAAALGSDPTSLAARLWLAETKLHREQLDEAETAFRSALAQAPHCAQAMTGLGRIAASRGDHPKAVERLRDALEHRPDSPPARYALAVALRRLGRLEEARTEQARLQGENYSLIITCFEDPLMQEVRRRATGTRAHEGRAIKAREDGLLATALVELQAAVRANPHRYPARYDIANLMLRLGRVEEARAELEDLVAQRPHYAAALSLLARMEADAGNWERVDALHSRAVAADPDSEETRLTFGDLLRSHGRIDRALGEYDRALELNSALVGAIVGRALCLAESGRGDEAAGYLGELRQTLPTRGRIPTTQVQILLASGSPETLGEALSIARDANSNQPTIASAMVLALALAQSGDFEEAAAWQSKALAAMPTEASWTTQRERAGDRLAAYRAKRKIPASLDADTVLALSLTQPLQPEGSSRP